ncbi:MAG TPA: DUF917 domain-containing protein [Anaerolineae bacterium]|nr:DUF917 domain-containing protein [Anaerolineae bacterium]HIQ06597.1 DUF917 domain-containing protein [Anaerolineae bacterium]
MRKLYSQNIEDLALGAAVLGTGGGGDPYIGKLMAIHAIEKYGPVTLLSLDEVDDDMLIVPSAMMGAPTVIVEKLPKGDEIINAFKMLESYLGQKIDATISIEAGGLNSTTPLTVAARLGLPMVDCDGMGRAFPEIPMVTFTLCDISATPFAMADEKGNSAILNTINNHWTETFARSITVDMGATALIACYAVTGKQLKKCSVPGTITLAEEIGRAIREARTSHADVIEAVLNVTGGFQVFKGKVTDVRRRTVAGFARGEATFEGIDGYAGSKLELNFQNENLVAIRDGEIIVSVPDLITVLDAENGQPITTETLRYGYRVVVLGIPCNAKWRTPEGLKLVGPRYFGYDIDYVPVEERFGAHT